MARIRSVHPGLFTDGDYVQLTPDAFMFIVGIWTECDDQGVFEWKPVELRIRLRPGRDGDVVPLLDELMSRGLVRQFEVDGRMYGACRNFRKWQRPEKPKNKYPLPDDIRQYVRLSPTDPQSNDMQSPTDPITETSQSPTKPKPRAASRQPVDNQSPKVSAEEGGRRKDVGGRIDNQHTAASVSASHAAHAALRKRLVDIAGDAFVSDRAADDIRPILESIAHGADLKLDVIPVVSEFAERGPTLSTWKPVAMAIAERMSAKAQERPFDPDELKPQEWELTVQSFKKFYDDANHKGRTTPPHAWSEKLGPRPDQPGCKAPPDVLTRHGFAGAAS